MSSTEVKSAPPFSILLCLSAFVTTEYAFMSCIHSQKYILVIISSTVIVYLYFIVKYNYISLQPLASSRFSAGLPGNPSSYFIPNVRYSSKNSHEDSKKVKAFVLNSDKNRWIHTSNLLTRCGVLPIRVSPVPLNSTVFQEIGGFTESTSKFFKAFSNKLTQIYVWRTIAFDSDLDFNDGYALVIEDDIQLSNHVLSPSVPQIIQNAARLSKEAGVFYLGMCFADGNACNEFRMVIDSIEYRQCVGRCAHAYGVFKWKAVWLYDELQARLQYSNRQNDFFFMDVYLHYGLQKQTHHPILAGSNLSSPEILAHRGIFFQSRKLFPSTMGLGW